MFLSDLQIKTRALFGERDSFLAAEGGRKFLEKLHGLIGMWNGALRPKIKESHPELVQKAREFLDRVYEKYDYFT